VAEGGKAAEPEIAKMAFPALQTTTVRDQTKREAVVEGAQAGAVLIPDHIRVDLVALVEVVPAEGHHKVQA
jgi:hypothetical protein